VVKMARAKERVKSEEIGGAIAGWLLRMVGWCGEILE
jgi:hypothetical protein